MSFLFHENHANNACLCCISVDKLNITDCSNAN